MLLRVSSLPTVLVILAWASPQVCAQEAEPSSDATPKPAERAIGVLFTEEDLLEFIEYTKFAFDDAGFPGLAMATVQGDGKMSVSAMGVRDLEGAQKVTHDTRFAVGEVSGAVTSLLGAVSTHEGEIDWDDRLQSTGNAAFRLDDSRQAPVTLRNVFSQTGGLSTHLDAVINAPGHDMADLAALLQQTQLTDAPERRYQRSRAGLAAGGYAIALQRAGGVRCKTPHEVFQLQLREAVLVPLGMQGAAFSRLELIQTKDFAIGHDLTSDGGWAVSESYEADTVALLPAQGLRACIIDVAVWLSCEVRHGLSVYGFEVVPPRAITDRWQPVLRTLGTQPALGWQRDYVGGLPVLISTGSIDRQSALVAILPEQQTALAVLTNVPGEVSASLFRDLLITFCETTARAEQRADTTLPQATTP
ncbi:MAG: serine hydrolase domain-containing protein [Opitutales bacterium]